MPPQAVSRIVMLSRSALNLSFFMRQDGAWAVSVAYHWVIRSRAASLWPFTISLFVVATVLNIEQVKVGGTALAGVMEANGTTLTTINKNV